MIHIKLFEQVENWEDPFGEDFVNDDDENDKVIIMKDVYYKYKQISLVEMKNYMEKRLYGKYINLVDGDGVIQLENILIERVLLKLSGNNSKLAIGRGNMLVNVFYDDIIQIKN